jgi:plasmid stabilization system protein ParE
MVEIRNYIRDELQNPAAAERVLTRIAKSLRLLEDAPRIGSPLSSVIDIDTEYRFLISGNYLSFYRYYDDTCYIDRILYRRRDYISILFGIDAEPDET